MAARVPQNVDATHFGDWLRVEWDDDTGLAGDDPEGFEVWYGDTSVTVPVWADAVDTELTGGDGASPVQHYSVLFYTPDDVICDWETFEEYRLGDILVMARGGNVWDGPGLFAETAGWHGETEDFETYSIGTAPESMAAYPTSWSEPGIIVDF